MSAQKRGREIRLLPMPDTRIGHLYASYKPVQGCLCQQSGIFIGQPGDSATVQQRIQIRCRRLSRGFHSHELLNSIGPAVLSNNRIYWAPGSANLWHTTGAAPWTYFSSHPEASPPPPPFLRPCWNMYASTRWCNKSFGIATVPQLHYIRTPTKMQIFTYKGNNVKYI